MELPKTHSKQLLNKLERLPFHQNDIIKLVDNQTDMFPVLDLRYLTMSSTNRLDIYRQLLNHIQQFNKTLEEWHKGKIQIPSVRTQYNIYSNLKTRLQTIILIPNQDLLIKNLEQCLEWFEQVTTKKFKHNVDQLFETLRSTKPQKSQISGEDQVYMMYKKMGRTAHGEIPPPNQRLSYYKKRQSVFPIEDLTLTKQSFYSERKTNLFGMTSGKETIQSTARDINTADVQQDDGLPLQNYEQLQGITEGNQNQSIAYQKNVRKIYADNDDPNIKTQFKKANMNSRLKLLNDFTNQTKSKMQEREIVKEMSRWSKAKSRKESQFSRAMEYQTRDTTNGILQPAFNKQFRKRTLSLKSFKSATLVGSSINPQFKSQFKKSIDLTQLNSKDRMSFQDKIGNINSNIKSQKMRQILKQNLKNVQHCIINQVGQTEQDRRYTSQSSTRPKLPQKTLTSFMKKRGSSVTDILKKNCLAVQNDLNLQIAMKIKEQLLKKGTYLGNKTIQNSLMQYIYQGDDDGNIYRSGQKLLSNPWFPKTKGKSKKSKKRL